MVVRCSGVDPIPRKLNDPSAYGSVDHADRDIPAGSGTGGGVGFGAALRDGSGTGDVQELTAKRVSPDAPPMRKVRRSTNSSLHRLRDPAAAGFSIVPHVGGHMWPHRFVMHLRDPAS